MSRGNVGSSMAHLELHSVLRLAYGWTILHSSAGSRPISSSSSQSVGLTQTNGPCCSTMAHVSHHVSYDVAQLAHENRVAIVCLPPHASHLMQSMGVRVYKGVKQLGERF